MSHPALPAYPLQPPAAMPQDPALPQLAQALDTQAMGRVFAAELPAHQVLGCVVDRVKYRPGRNCSVSYRLRLRTAVDGEFEQRVAARFCSGGDAAQRHRKAARQAWQPSPAGPALSHVPALDMLAFWLPNDAKLDALRWLQDPAALRQRSLLPLLADLGGATAELIDHDCQLVQLVPELRVCCRVQLRWRPAPGAAERCDTLYAKAASQRSGALTHAVMLALSASQAQASGRLHTPRSLAWQADAGLHWQQGVPGQALGRVDPAVGPASAAAVGRLLAALHGCAVPAPALADAAALATQRQQALALLQAAGLVQDDAHQPRLSRLAGWLQQAADALVKQPAVTLHGDLHPANLLVDGDRLWLIDFDSVRIGPAALELGGWVADSLQRALLTGQPLVDAARSWRAFLAGYEAAGGAAVPGQLLAWGAVHHLVCRRASGNVANLKPGRLAAVPQLLRWAEQIAAAGSVEAVLTPQPAGQVLQAEAAIGPASAVALEPLAAEAAVAATKPAAMPTGTPVAHLHSLERTP